MDKDPAFERVLASLKARRPEWFDAPVPRKVTTGPAKAAPVGLDARQKASGEREEVPWPDECPF